MRAWPVGRPLPPGHRPPFRYPPTRDPAFREYHLIGDILVIAQSALLVCARSWEGIAEFGRS
jgi:hypothetical protein